MKLFTPFPMIVKAIFSFLFLFNLGMLSSQAQCEIGELTIDDHPCDSNGMFHVYFDFDYANVSDSGFVLYVNDNLFGYYFYEDLPIENLGPFEGDGTTVYHFLVRDVDNYDCAEDKNFGPIDCGTGGDCNIWDVFADVMPCNESGYFNVALDFEFVNVGNDGFRVQGNGNNYGSFSYDSIPVMIGPLEGDGLTTYEFVVIDNQLEECSDFTGIDPVDCDPPVNCEIGEIETIILPCNENNEFFVLLDFDFANTSDGFTVQGNGINYGSFLYANVPVEIGPLSGDGTTIYEFLVRDEVHEDCASDTYIDPVHCDSVMQFMNFSTEVIACDNQMYELKLDFELVNGSGQGFTLHGNGEVYGSFEYSQLPLSIGPLATDGSTAYHFIARDLEKNSGNWGRLIPFTCESLGLEEADKEPEFMVYPNPSSGSITFEYEGNTMQDVVVYNSAGAEIRSFSFSSKHSIHGMEGGIYYYRIMNNGKVIGSGKLIVSE